MASTDTPRPSAVAAPVGILPDSNAGNGVTAGVGHTAQQAGFSVSAALGISSLELLIGATVFFLVAVVVMSLSIVNLERSQPDGPTHQQALKSFNYAAGFLIIAGLLYIALLVFGA